MSHTAHVIIIGSGGHAKVLLDTLQALAVPVDAMVIEESQRAPAAALAGLFSVQRILTDDMLLANGDRQAVSLVNGIGSIADTALRQRIHATYLAAGFRFATITHPSAVVSRHARLGEGAQIMAGAILQPGVDIGANVIINTGAVIDHDCIIGAHTHIAPAAALSGGVRVGAGCHVGTGARIIQGIRIGDACLVGAGAVVLRDLEPQQRVAGVPARNIRR